MLSKRSILLEFACSFVARRGFARDFLCTVAEITGGQARHPMVPSTETMRDRLKYIMFSFVVFFATPKVVPFGLPLKPQTRGTFKRHIF